MLRGRGSRSLRARGAPRSRRRRLEAQTRAGGVRATRLEEALDWAAALAPSPIVQASSCCGMAWAHEHDVFEALGAGPPAASARAADLLIVAGTLTRRQVPMLRELYARMVEPRWVIAWGVCAISGGPYANYATISGLSRILPVDLVVPGCPPAPQVLRDALESLRTGEARRRRLASSGAHERPIGEGGTARDPVRSDSGRLRAGFE